MTKYKGARTIYANIFLLAFLILPYSAIANILYDRELLRSAPIEIFERALKDGVSPLTWSGDDGAVSPLHLAAIYNRFDLVDLLIEYGANIEAPASSGCTPISSAAIQGSTSMVEHLISLGAEVNIPRCPPLNWAIGSLNEFDAVEKVRVLINAGADPNQSFNGEFALNTAAKYQDYGLEIIKILLEAGADFKAISPNGRDVAAQAVKYFNLSVLNYFLEKFPDLLFRSQTGISLSLYIIDADVFTDSLIRQRTETLSFLLSAGISVDEVDAAGRTLLHFAALIEDSYLIQDLIKFGADPSIRDRSGQLPLDIASRGALFGHPAYYALKDITDNWED